MIVYFLYGMVLFHEKVEEIDHEKLVYALTKNKTRSQLDGPCSSPDSNLESGVVQRYA
jgi:hypothetical protein